MARYIERAENTARTLDVQFNASLMPGLADPEESWGRLLRLYELHAPYVHRYGEPCSEGVLLFMVNDASNPSSIWSSFAMARENARAVRALLSPELFEAVNAAWLEMPSRLTAKALRREPGRVLEWIKLQSHVFRGALLGTLQQSEPYRFCRIGTYIERADNTARILALQFQQSTPLPGVADRPPAESTTSGPSSADYYTWSSLLRALAALEIYRQVYRDGVAPLKAAELLMRRSDVPRSLLYCLLELRRFLSEVAAGPQSTAFRRAGRMCAELEFFDEADWQVDGLESTLTHFLSDLARLGEDIQAEFFAPRDKLLA